MKSNGHSNGAANGHTNPVGHPFIPLDLALIEDLAGIFCTMKEIAAICKCSVDTLERNCADVIEKGRENAKASLRRKQYLVATNGAHAREEANVTMLIWLGKQQLGQRDSLELSGPNGGPIQHEHIKFDALTDEQLSDLERLVNSAVTSDTGRREG
jgi:hypothetical protein